MNQQADQTIIVRPTLKDRKLVLGISLLFVASGTAITLGVLLSDGEFSKKPWGYILGLGHLGLGLLATYFTAPPVFSAWRFRRSWLEASTGPIRPGSDFAAMVYLPEVFGPEDRLILWVINEEAYEDATGDSTEVKKKQLYVHKQNLAAYEARRGAAVDGRGQSMLAIEVTAPIPADSKDERNNRKEGHRTWRYYWYVQVNSEVQGVDLDLRFPLPTEGQAHANV